MQIIKQKNVFLWKNLHFLEKICTFADDLDSKQDAKSPRRGIKVDSF